MPLLLLIATIFLAACAHQQQSPWAKIQFPSPGKSEAIGKHSAGCLLGGKSLLPDDLGYQVMQLSRGRFYGHESLINFLQTLSKKMQQKKLGRLLIGDLSYPQGGPFLTEHASHQTGLDADLWFLQSKESDQRRLSLSERESLQSPSVISPLGDQINMKYWNPRLPEILKLASEDSRVERIFVHHLIKRYLCEKFSNQKWIEKIRPWYGHDDHFHLRLKCPEDNLRCVHEPLVQEVHFGCSTELDWWLTAEAKSEAIKHRDAQKSRRDLPELPQACQERVSQAL